MHAQSFPQHHPDHSHRAALRRVDSPGPIDLEGPGARVLELVRAIERRIAQRPLTAVAAAIGIGFLVGGALSFRAGRIALAAATRYVAREVFKQVL
jgi:hypothetical protein